MPETNTPQPDTPSDGLEESESSSTEDEVSDFWNKATAPWYNKSWLSV